MALMGSAVKRWAAIVGLVALAACASQPDLASKPVVQQAQAAKPASTQPTSTLQAAPQGRPPVLAPNQLIPGLAGNAASPIVVQPGLSAPPRPTPDASGLVRVGMLVPLTGQSAPVGMALLNAAPMALFDVGDERFVLHAYDTKGTPEGAVDAATLALNHGAQLLLGPLFSAEVRAVAPQAAAAGVNMVVFSTDPAIAGPNVFVMGFLVQEQVRQIVA